VVGRPMAAIRALATRGARRHQVASSLRRASITQRLHTALHRSRAAAEVAIRGELRPEVANLPIRVPRKVVTLAASRHQVLAVASMDRHMELTRMPHKVETLAMVDTLPIRTEDLTRTAVLEHTAAPVLMAVPADMELMAPMGRHHHQRST